MSSPTSTGTTRKLPLLMKNGPASPTNSTRSITSPTSNSLREFRGPQSPRSSGRMGHYAGYVEPTPSSGASTPVGFYESPSYRSGVRPVLPTNARAPGGILPELAMSPGGRSPASSATGRNHRRQHHCSGRMSGSAYSGKGNGLVPSPPPHTLTSITSMAGDALLFSDTNMDWNKLNIFRTRLCDRLTQTHTCHMANRCLFSHDVNWPRRTPFLPRASSLTLRYIPVWCPRLVWPPLLGLCDSSGRISWTSEDPEWDARSSHHSCTRGDNCPFVHNLEEFLYHPEVYKTRSCCLANDDNFEEMASNCVALCPWYFCPFAHDRYELRNLRGARYAWHPPPQIVDNQFVARTQGFDQLEMQIIDFIRKAPNGSLDLYESPLSPLKYLWRHRRMPPVIRPLKGCALDQLVATSNHRDCQFDDLLYVMVIASLLNLLLYQVENFYVPTLLSLQCSVLQFQLGIPGPIDCAHLMEEWDNLKAAAERLEQRDKAQEGVEQEEGEEQEEQQDEEEEEEGQTPEKQCDVDEETGEEDVGDETEAFEAAIGEELNDYLINGEVDETLLDHQQDEIRALLDLLKPEEIMKVMAIIEESSSPQP